MLTSRWNLSGLSLKELLRRVWKSFWADSVLDQSAKLSFYFLLSFFPLLLFLLEVLGVFLKSGPEFRQTLQDFIAAFAPASASGIMNSTLSEISAGSGGIKVSLALVFTWWSASQGMLAVMDGLNLAYGVAERRKAHSRYLKASALTLFALFFMSGAFLLVIYGGRFSEFIALMFGLEGWMMALLKALGWLVSLFMILLAFNLVYVYAPNVRHRRWSWVMPGTFAGVGIWLFASFSFKAYLSQVNLFNVTYGSIGGVIILLLWFYLTGIAILVGAKVNSEIEKAAGEVEEDPG